MSKKIRAMLEKEIVELNEKRDLIDGELSVLVKMIGVIDPPRHARKKFKRRPSSEVAAELLKKHDEVTPNMLAEKARISGASAQAMLAKVGKKVRRGVYSR